MLATKGKGRLLSAKGEIALWIRIRKGVRGSESPRRLEIERFPRKKDDEDEGLCLQPKVLFSTFFF